MKKKQLTGIILSGGKSSRMGGEKGLVSFRGNPLVSYAVKALTPVADTIIIGANNRLEEYKSFGFDVVQDEIPGIGPMGGLLSALKYSQTDDNLVISCDTPFVNAELLRYLYQNSAGYQVVVPSHHDGKLEPLCGFYSRQITGVLEDCIGEGEYKLRSIFKRLKFKTLPVRENLPFYHERLFYNINKPEDLTL